MNTRLIERILFPVALSVLLVGCQVVNAISSSLAAGAPTQAAPLPLTGARASAAGASALMLVDKPTHGVQLEPVSASTGQPVAGFTPIDFGDNAQYAFSPDRETLAFVSSSAAACSGLCLHLLDLLTWKETITPLNLSMDGSMWAILAFNWEGTQVAVGLNNQTGPGGLLLLVNLAQVKIIQQASLTANVDQVAIMPDGSVALYGNLPPQPGQANAAYVTLFDGASLKVKWHQELDMVSYGNDSEVNITDPSQGQFYYPAAVYSPDHQKLYIVAADEPRLVTVDFARQAVSSVDIHPRQSLLEEFLASTASTVYAKAMNGAVKSGVLSLDGKTIYVVGQKYTAVKDTNGDWTEKITPLGFQAVDLSSGTEVATLASDASNIALSLDGKTILLNGSEQSSSGLSQYWTDIMDLATFQVTSRLDGEIAPTRLLDGSLAWLSTVWVDNGSNQLAIYDPGSQTPRSQRKGSILEDPAWISIP